MHSPQHLSIDEISNSISDRFFEFCDPQLFQETLQNSEVASSSNRWYQNNDNDNNSSTRTTSSTNTTTGSNEISNLSVIFNSWEELDNDISASIGFSGFQEDEIECDFPLMSVFDEDSLSSYYLPFNAAPSSSCSFLCSPMAMRTFVPGPGHDLDFQGEDGGFFSSGSMPAGFDLVDPQEGAMGNESEQNASGSGDSSHVASKMEESTFKVGKLSVEERKEKIHRYMKKRNERNFSKKIKYACRKTLADSRPRVRGRFAKNDGFGDTYCRNHDDDYDDQVVVKEEDEMVDSLDIFAHISGVNSFKCNYTINSWI